jgi:hypothetical protein
MSTEQWRTSVGGLGMAKPTRRVRRTARRAVLPAAVLDHRRPLDHPGDHPDDPTGPVSIRLDRPGIQREQARSVWNRPDRRRAPGYGSGGWGFESLAARQRRRSMARTHRTGRLRPHDRPQPHRSGGRRVHHQDIMRRRGRRAQPGGPRPQGLKRSVASDSDGIPLGWVVAPANTHDSPLLAPTLDRVSDLRPSLADYLGRGRAPR